MNEQEKILEALNLLKNTCLASKTCAECPFYSSELFLSSGDGCAIQSKPPCHYNITSEPKVFWRAFKKEEE